MGRRLLGMCVVLCLAAAACGGDDDGSSSGPSQGAASGAGQPEASEPAASGPHASAVPNAEVDLEGEVRLAYDLVGASRGGFSWDPSESLVSSSDVGLFHWVYGGLMRPDPEGTLVPGLAEGFTVVDPNTIEVTLRNGLTLSDGRPFDASMVKAGLERNLSKPDLPAFGAEFYKLSKIAVVNPTTVRLTIPDGTAGSWADVFLGGPETVIVPPDTDFQKPVGAGPFRVVEFAPQERVVLEKNPDYWNAEAIKLSRVVLVNAPDAQTGVAALNAGQVDWARLGYMNVDAVGADFETLVFANERSLVHLPICKTTEPFTEPQVRRALSMAIDRESINQALWDGEGIPASDLWPEGHDFHNPELEDLNVYDPERARELLADAGYPDGFTFDMIPYPTSSMPELAQILQQQWADIGVTVNLLSGANFVTDFYVEKQAPVAVLPTLGFTGVGQLRQWVGGTGGNTCGYDDPELDKLADELLSVSSDDPKAVNYWHDVQKKVIGEALSFFVVFPPSANAYDPEHVQGVRPAFYPVPVPDIWNMYVPAE